MRLDKAAQSALHVFPARTGARSSNSIYGILNHSRTAMGKRLLRSWLKQPLTDVSAIQERHQIVKIFVDDVSLRCALQDLLHPYVSCWNMCNVVWFTRHHRTTSRSWCGGLLLRIACLVYATQPVHFLQLLEVEKERVVLCLQSVTSQFCVGKM